MIKSFQSLMVKVRENLGSKNYLALLLVVLLALAIRIFFVSGLLLDLSINIAKTSNEFSSVFGAANSQIGFISNFRNFLAELRILPSELSLLVPITGYFYFLFGVSDLSSLLLPLISALGIGILIYLLGSYFFAKASGVIAAFFWALLPLGVFFSINLIAVLPILLLNTFAILLFIISGEGK